MNTYSTLMHKWAHQTCKSLNLSFKDGGELSMADWAVKGKSRRVKVFIPADASLAGLCSFIQQEGTTELCLWTASLLFGVQTIFFASCSFHQLLYAAILWLSADTTCSKLRTSGNPQTPKSTFLKELLTRFFTNE